jgi:hypothetical protein
MHDRGQGVAADFNVSISQTGQHSLQRAKHRKRGLAFR